MDGAAVQLSCPLCISGDKRIGKRYGKIVHVLPQVATFDVAERYQPCPDWDDEFRHVSEPMGFHRFAWRPVRCRNGKRRWLTCVEAFPDGTFALGNRAH